MLAKEPELVDGKLNLEIGQIVRVRSRQYLIESISSPRNLDEATIVRMSCVEDDAQGEQLEVL